MTKPLKILLIPVAGALLDEVADLFSDKMKPLSTNCRLFKAAGILTVITLQFCLNLSCNSNRSQGNGSDYINPINIMVEAIQTVEGNEAVAPIPDIPPGPVNYNMKLSRIVDSSGLTISDLYVLIEKSEYLLSVMSDSAVLKQYPVVFGRNPIDPKLMEGDGCTPEGTFSVITKYEHRMWSKFIYFDYPNRESMRRFREAVAGGEVPPDASPGGQIGIHGVPEGMDFAIRDRMNWTAGCISLKNKDINELYDYVMTGSKVVIRK